MHLYRPDAETAGAATAVLWLVVRGPGFLSGAVIASLLTTAALIACIFTASSIAVNPSSAPALLIALPGLIASYVARPDQHALTTRLLSLARWLLLASAGCAYVAAGRVALSGGVPKDPMTIVARGDSLRGWFFVLAVIAAVCLVGLVVGWWRGLDGLGESGGLRYQAKRFMPMPASELAAHLRANPTSPDLVPSGEVVQTDGADSIVTFSDRHLAGRYFIEATVIPFGAEGEQEAGNHPDCLLKVQLHLTRFFHVPWLDRYLVRRRAKGLTDKLDELQRWAQTKAA